MHAHKHFIKHLQVAQRTSMWPSFVGTPTGFMSMNAKRSPRTAHLEHLIKSLHTCACQAFHQTPSGGSCNNVGTLTGVKRMHAKMSLHSADLEYIRANRAFHQTPSGRSAHVRAGTSLPRCFYIGLLDANTSPYDMGQAQQLCLKLQWA